MRSLLQAVSAVILLGILTFSVVPKNTGIRKPNLVIRGTVIAYQRSFSQLVRHTSVYNLEVLIVRIEKRFKGREESPYIKVLYRYADNEPDLAKEFFNSKGQWRFTLVRDRSCDTTSKEMMTEKDTKDKNSASIPQIRLTPEGETVNLPNDATLPCYVLRPGGYKFYNNLNTAHATRFRINLLTRNSKA